MTQGAGLRSRNDDSDPNHHFSSVNAAWVFVASGTAVGAQRRRLGYAARFADPRPLTPTLNLLGRLRDAAVRASASGTRVARERVAAAPFERIGPVEAL